MSTSEQQQSLDDQPKGSSKHESHLTSIENRESNTALVNPFSKRESFSARSLGTYKILSLLSWLLVVVFAFIYTFHAPSDGQNDGHYHTKNRTIWGQNSANQTPFKLNSVMTTIYWSILVVLQLGYMQRLFSSNIVHATAAANVGSHFIFNNLFTFAFLMLWTRGNFWWAEVVAVINFFNMSSLYFRHSTTPLLIHVAAVSGPLALTFVTIFWDGAAMVHAHSLPARIAANIFIWAFLGYGLFFLVAFRDWTMGVCMSYLAACKFRRPC